MLEIYGSFGTRWVIPGLSNSEINAECIFSSRYTNEEAILLLRSSMHSLRFDVVSEMIAFRHLLYKDPKRVIEVIKRTTLPEFLNEIAKELHRSERADWEHEETSAIVSTHPDVGKIVLALVNNECVTTFALEIVIGMAGCIDPSGGLYQRAVKAMGAVEKIPLPA